MVGEGFKALRYLHDIWSFLWKLNPGSRVQNVESVLKRFHLWPQSLSLIQFFKFQPPKPFSVLSQQKKLSQDQQNQLKQ